MVHASDGHANVSNGPYSPWTQTSDGPVQKSADGPFGVQALQHGNRTKHHACACCNAVVCGTVRDSQFYVPPTAPFAPIVLSYQSTSLGLPHHHLPGGPNSRPKTSLRLKNPPAAPGTAMGCHSKPHCMGVLSNEGQLTVLSASIDFLSSGTIPSSMSGSIDSFLLQYCQHCCPQA